MLDQAPTISSHISKNTQRADVSANNSGSVELRFESLSRLHINLAVKTRRKYSFHQITND